MLLCPVRRNSLSSPKSLKNYAAHPFQWHYRHQRYEQYNDDGLGPNPMLVFPEKIPTEGI